MAHERSAYARLKIRTSIFHHTREFAEAFLPLSRKTPYITVYEEKFSLFIIK